MSAIPPNAAPAQGKSSFVLRILKIIVNAADGTTYTFDGSPLSWAPFVPGLAIECQVEHAMLPSPGGSVYVRIYGMTLDQMNALSIAGTLWAQNQHGNFVSVYAGDSSSALTLIAKGQIIEARPEFPPRDPNTSFFISAIPALGVQMNNTVTPTSFKGATSAETLLQAVCSKVGVTLDYEAPPVMLSSPYFAGGAWDQIAEIVAAAKLRSAFDGRTNTLTVIAQTGFAAGTIATISPANGMIGYPQFQANLVSVKTIFDPSIADIVRGPTGQVQIQSQLTAACGTFVVAHMDYNLSCNIEGGPWEIDIACYPAAQGAGGVF